MRREGFTLLELLLSISILVIITSLVYASFSSVVETSARSREAMMETRLRQFLTRSLTSNLKTVYVDADYALAAFQFIGESEDSREGPKDRLRFCSTAALAGGAAMPGDIKEVRLEVIDPDDQGSLFDVSEDDVETYDRRTLRVTETPLLAANVQTLTEDSGVFEAAEGFETPHWSLPVRSMDIAYFDGEAWLEEWDSVEMGRLPWAVRAAINFQRTEEELEKEADRGLDPLESPEYMLTITLPLGLRVTEDQSSADEESGGDGEDRGDG